MNGMSQHEVVLDLGILAYNLLIEEYPLAERDIEQMEDGRWRLTTYVASFVGVGRFVVGLIDDIEIVDTPLLTEYIRNYAKKIEKI